MTTHKAVRWLLITFTAVILLVMSVVLPLGAAADAWIAKNAAQEDGTPTPARTPASATPVQTESPTLTLTLDPSPTSTRTLTNTSTPAPTPTPHATDTPISFSTPTATPTSSLIDRTVSLLSERWPAATTICLLPLLILALLLILLILWRRKPQPEPPPPPPQSPQPSSPPTPEAPHLESETPPRRFELSPQGITIGRGPESDLLITEVFPAWETVSRHHARIYRQAGQWIVEDLDSKNGVYVNGKRTNRNLLRDGWQLSIGGVTFVFHTGPGEVR